MPKLTIEVIFRRAGLHERQFRRFLAIMAILAIENMIGMKAVAGL
jgi:hypothetical protein